MEEFFARAVTGGTGVNGLKMGWLKESSPENYDLGPNLRQEFFTDMVPNLETTRSGKRQG